ncbi:MAG TPA: hypothetical protein DCY35_02785 [Prolixibacteraceae bacterium]|nr:hypothetical protein [Prolixibacteraceae bacterium]
MQTPAYQHIISTARQSVHIFDDSTLGEIHNFLEYSQHDKGGFKDRAGKPDLYYSLFGMWSALALDEKESLNQLRVWIESRQDEKHQSVIEIVCLFLIKKSLGMKGSGVLIFKLMVLLASTRKNISPYYRLFIGLLLVDSLFPTLATLKWPGRNRLLKKAERMTSSCTEAAAALVVLATSGGNTLALQEKILTFFDVKTGFRAFHGKRDGDLLSTAAALFALQYSGYDLRAIKPACLDFIGRNYTAGAFLPGDGDPETDIEYTFYGLLAASSLYKFQ